MRTLGLAHYWQQLLDTGKVGSLTGIAAAERMDLGQFSRIARLAQLAPGVVEAVFDERSAGRTLHAQDTRGAKVDWCRQ